MTLVMVILTLLAPGALAGWGIVHLFEWRFDDIADECENFLAPMGYDAVQVSPVNEYAVLKGRPWYERYQPMSYKIISRSGDEKGFKNMCDRCRRVGVKIYADVVINHMTADLPAGTRGTGGSEADTTDKYYPAVPYVQENFHQTCEMNDFFNATNVRDCELVGLHDLDQSQEAVRGPIVAHMNQLLDLGVEGFRVDAAKHMWPADLQVIYSRLRNTQSGRRPFIFQEVFVDAQGEASKRTDYTPLGHVTEFGSGTQLTRYFRGQNPLASLKTFGPSWGFIPSDKALVFIDNHDTQRDNDPLTYKEPRNYKMATAFTLGFGYGYPKVMSSFYFDNKDQGPPANPDESIQRVTFYSNGSCANYVCEHRWTAIAGMIGFANAVQGTTPSNFWDNGSNQISFCRGNKGFIAFNMENYDMNMTTQTCLPMGIYCDVASGVKQGNSCTGKIVTVNPDGTAKISITGSGEGFLAIHINSKI